MTDEKKPCDGCVMKVQYLSSGPLCSDCSRRSKGVRLDRWSDNAQQSIRFLAVEVYELQREIDRLLELTKVSAPARQLIKGRTASHSSIGSRLIIETTHNDVVYVGLCDSSGGKAVKYRAFDPGGFSRAILSLFGTPVPQEET